MHLLAHLKERRKRTKSKENLFSLHKKMKNFIQISKKCAPKGSIIVSTNGSLSLSVEETS